MLSDRIRLAHGSGGALMHELIARVIVPRFGGDILGRLEDAAELPDVGGRRVEARAARLHDRLLRRPAALLPRRRHREARDRGHGERPRRQGRRAGVPHARARDRGGPPDRGPRARARLGGRDRARRGRRRRRRRHEGRRARGRRRAHREHGGHRRRPGRRRARERAGAGRGLGHRVRHDRRPRDGDRHRPEGTARRRARRERLRGGARARCAPRSTRVRTSASCATRPGAGSGRP